MHNKPPKTSRKDLIIRGIYLPYIGFFGVLDLFRGAWKPYHPLAALLVENAGALRPVRMQRKV
jgi:hypothetical protein